MTSQPRGDRKRFLYSQDPWIPASSDDDFRVRLVRLEPLGNLDPATPVKCHLFWTSLAARPFFKALSYTWGTDTASRTIHVGDMYLPVTPSLEVALQHIRHKTDSVTIWIDQISINQSDDIEKNEQVARIGQIFEAASEVIVWLGPAADESDEVMDVWNLIGRTVLKFDSRFHSDEYSRERDLEMLRFVTDFNAEDPRMVRLQNIFDTLLEAFDKDTLRAMIAWQDRPWFSRIWVVQEYALGHTVTIRCGNKTISVDNLEVAVDFVAALKYRMAPELIPLCEDLLSNDSMTILTNARSARSRLIRGTGTGDCLYELIKLLYTDSCMYATVACDHIYGLLGLATDTNKLGLRADYTLASRTDLVFARTTKALLANQYDAVLSMVRDANVYSKLPSWIPDFTSGVVSSFIGTLPKAMADKDIFSASGRRKGQILDIEDEMILGLTGYVVDEVEDLRDVWSLEHDLTFESRELFGADSKLKLSQNRATETDQHRGENDATQFELSGVPYSHHQYKRWLCQVRSLCQKSYEKGKTIYSSKERREQAVWRVPVGDLEMDHNFHVVRASQDSATAYTLCKRAYEFLDNFQSLSPIELEENIAAWEQDEASWLPRKYRARMRWMLDKRPFLTKDGYVGMGPDLMKEGDLVAVLGMATLPYVVRRLEGKSNKYILLGECYCDGIMDGEIVGQREEQEFHFV